MPIYRFRCSRCKHITDKLFTTVPEQPAKMRPKCPECSAKMSYVYSPGVGLSFKGSGWTNSHAERGDD